MITTGYVKNFPSANNFQLTGIFSRAAHLYKYKYGENILTEQQSLGRRLLQLP